MQPGAMQNGWYSNYILESLAQGFPWALHPSHGEVSHPCPWRDTPPTAHGTDLVHARDAAERALPSPRRSSKPQAHPRDRQAPPAAWGCFPPRPGSTAPASRHLRRKRVCLRPTSPWPSPLPLSHTPTLLPPILLPATPP